MSSIGSFEILKEKVLALSASKHWYKAKKEWYVLNMFTAEDVDDYEVCVCGHDPIKHIFTIKNKETDETVYPIGCVCVKAFEEEALTDSVDAMLGFAKLGKTLLEGNEIEFTGKFFTKKMIIQMRDFNVFVPSEYNHFDAEEDLQFMIDMFRKRKRSCNQDRKIWCLLNYRIKPFLKRFYRACTEQE